jgi:dimethylargininase
MRVQTAVIGGVADSYADCEREDARAVLDAERAREQHTRYAAALGAAVPNVLRVAAPAAHPDCVFVEDAAVVIDAERAVLTRPGVTSRLGEVEEVEGVLAPLLRLERLRAPATLDGGDVLRVGDVLFVGLSGRTNSAGANALAAIAREAGIESQTLRVARGLHLKSACSLAAANTLVYDPDAGLDLGAFRALGLACVAAAERFGANVLALGDGRVLVSASAPATAALLRTRGLEVTVIAMSEFHKADGALTCCSIRIPARGAWCT